jgi:murein L,D-transpeptidase YafK
MKKYILLIFTFTLTVYYFYPEKQLSNNQKADNIIVFKSKRKLELRKGPEIIGTYCISLGKNPIGAKTQRGDHKTPEGIFSLRKHPNSKYNKALDISYNNYNNNVEIHGLQYSLVGKFQRFKDWTDGCIAVTNDEIDEIYDAIENNSKIEITP